LLLAFFGQLIKKRRWKTESKVGANESTKVGKLGGVVGVSDTFEKIQKGYF
jgi:hypothetical protein